MASVFNNIAVWGTTVDEYGSSSYTISGGNTPGFVAGNLIYAQQVNKAFRNATIVPYAIAQMMTGVNVGSSFNIGFDVDPANIAAFASSFKTVFNSYIQSAIKVNSASMADAASAFSTARTIRLTGDVTGSVASTGATGWAFATTIGTSKVLSGMISANAITSAKIATSAVISSKISDNAITSAKIATSAVITDKISANAVTSDKIANNAITTAKIGIGQVTNIKLATPWTRFTNSNNSTVVLLDGTRPLRDLFGFNSTDPSGTVRFRGEGLGYFYVDPDADGEQLQNVPTFYLVGTNISSIKFPNAIRVGGYAFMNCKNLSYISLPKAEYIYGAFYGCTNLTEINLPNIKQLLTPTFSFDTAINGGTFEGCTRLNSVTLGSNIEVIDASTFDGCTNLYQVTNLSKVKIIDSYAFRSCENLGYTGSQNMTFTNCSYLGGAVFASLTSIKEMHFPNLQNLGGSISGSYNIIPRNENGYFPRNLEILDLGTFDGFPNIKYGSYQNTNIFNIISSISTVNTLSKIYMSHMRVIPYMGSLFYPHNSNIVELVDISNAEYITREAFSGACKLSKLTTASTSNYLSKLKAIGGSVEYISSTQSINYHSNNFQAGSVFYSCSALTNFYAPNCSILTGGYNFANCINLSIIKLQGLQIISIASYTFYNCAALREINLYSCSILSGEAMFSNCTNLSKIWLGYNGVVSGVRSGQFSNTQITSTTGSIYVPTDALRTQYQSASGWSWFSNRIFASTSNT